MNISGYTIFNSSMVSRCPMGAVLKGVNGREKALKRRISLLRKREKEIREKRHRLESQLRTLVYQKYTRLGEKISFKIEKEL